MKGVKPKKVAGEKVTFYINYKVNKKALKIDMKTFLQILTVQAHNWTFDFVFVFIKVGTKIDDYWEPGKALLQDPTKFLEGLFKYDKVNCFNFVKKLYDIFNLSTY